MYDRMVLCAYIEYYVILLLWYDVHYFFVIYVVYYSEFTVLGPEGPQS